MKVNILDMKKFLKEGNYKEVTSSSIYKSGDIAPHPEGLGSYEIFGQPGTDERKHNWGWIDLHDYFIFPHALKVMKLFNRLVYDVVYGNGEFYVKDKKLQRVVSGQNLPPSIKTGCGVNFLFSVWELLDFKPRPSDAPKTRQYKEYIYSLTKDEIFIDKWPVIPCFFRDIDTQGNKKNQYNSEYARLIEAASMIKTIKNNVAIYDRNSSTESHKKIQQTLDEQYVRISQFVGNTKGFIQKNILGKNTDYSCRLVASGPNFNAERPNSADATFTHCGLPLHATVSSFFPFIKYGLKEFFMKAIAGQKYVMAYNSKTKTHVREEINPTMDSIYSTKEFRKYMELFEQSKYHRLNPVVAYTVDGTEFDLYKYYIDENDVLSRAPNDMEEPPKDAKVMNWCELLYIVCEQMCADKFAYITRYPVEDYNSIVPFHINVLPSLETRRVYIKDLGMWVERFPVFKKKQHEYTEVEIDGLFSDTLKIFNSFLGGYGGDYDGDMYSVQGVWSKEGCADAKRRIHSIINISSIQGNAVRSSDQNSAQAYYSLTKRRN